MGKIYTANGRVKCLYCGCSFPSWENHPPNPEFVNGYPSPCRKIGIPATSILTSGSEVWLMMDADIS